MRKSQAMLNQARNREELGSRKGPDTETTTPDLGKQTWKVGKQNSTLGKQSMCIGKQSPILESKATPKTAKPAPGKQTVKRRFKILRVAPKKTKRVCRKPNQGAHTPTIKWSWGKAKFCCREPNQKQNIACRKQCLTNYTLFKCINVGPSTHIYIYIYIYRYVCVRQCSSPFNNDTSMSSCTTHSSRMFFCFLIRFAHQS